MIQTGILCVPRMDDEAAQSITTSLRDAIPDLLVIIEQGADSQRHWIEMCLTRWCDEEELDLVVTIGGTMPAPGPSLAEIVPEATATVIERSLPGLSQEMRFHAATQTSLALLDRGIVGIRGRTLIINLPEGPEAALLFLEAIVGLIEPTIAYLQETSDRIYLSDVLAPLSEDLEELVTDDPETQAVSEHSFGLDADEFAAFLRKG